MNYQRNCAIRRTKLASLISLVTLYGLAGCGGAGDAMPGATNITVKHDASIKRDTAYAMGGAGGGTVAVGTGGSAATTDTMLGTGGATTSIPDASIPRDTTPDLAADSARPPLDLGVGAETPVPLDMGVEVSRDATPLDLSIPDAPIDVPPDAPADRPADVAAPDAAEAGDHPDNDLPSDLPSDRAAILPDTADRPTADTAEAPAGPSCSNPAWAKKFEIRTAGGLAGDKDGNLFLANTLYVSVGFGGSVGTLTNTGDTDALVARLDPVTGAALWAKQFGDLGAQTATGVAVDKAGRVGLVGNYNGSMTIGTSSISNLSTWPNSFSGGLQAADGTGLWAISANLSADVGGSGVLAAIAANPNFDDFVVCGKANIAATELVAGAVAGGGYDIVVAKIKGSDGTILSARQIGGTGDQSCTAAAINDSGDVLIAGNFNGQLDFGAGALSPAPAASGASTVPWIAKLSGVDLGTIAAVSASPAPTSRTTGYVYGIDTDSAGNVAIAGSFTNALTFGTSTITSAGLQDAYVAKLGASLTHAWAKNWGDAKAQKVNSVAFDSSGNLTVVGDFLSAINIGSGGAVLTAASDSTGSGTDVLIAHLSGATGESQCGASYGDPLAQAAFNVVVPRFATGGNKDVSFISGTLLGLGGSVLNFGSVTLDTTGLSDPAYLWLARF